MKSKKLLLVLNAKMYQTNLLDPVDKGFTLNLKIYAGKEADAGQSVPTKVVMDLSNKLLIAGRTFGVHSPPAASTEEGRPCQLPGDRADLITLQSATYDLLHLVVTTGRLYRRAQSTAVPCHEPKMPHPDIRYSGIIPWYLLEVLRIELPTHLVTVSLLPAITSLIHYTTSGPRLFTCRHSRTRTLDSPSVSAAKPILSLSRLSDS
ncbi:hypothetical protein GEV33_002440 [Tenebrio molitor]|uniref:Uncharacterized protein n=1 Tax=Tenebrio molitor TaxID=7067 RepID=A0A8J6HRI3_TENMO|nr:hypothetical protein GEV33_002440 [Tenebrio molitor]